MITRIIITYVSRMSIASIFVLCSKLVVSLLVTPLAKRSACF